MNALQHGRNLRWTLTLTLWVAIASALANLPASHFPMAWLLAFTAPALVFLLLGRAPAVRPWQRLTVAAAFQIGAAYAAHGLAGELSRPAALACTLLPPLAYVGFRRQEADILLALFLAFCMMLVGVMLRGQAWTINLGVFVIAAALTLRTEARWSAFQAGNHRVVARESRSGRLLRPVLLAVACGISALGFLRLLTVLPTPTEQPVARGGSGASGSRPGVGLSDTFNLDGSQGSPLNLQSDRLLRVSTLDRGGVASDLYLRGAFFDIADLEGWRVADFRARTRDTSDRWVFRRPLSGVPVQGLEIERLAPAQGMVFVPPGGISITGIADLKVDERRAWFRQTDPNASARYGVEYQDLTRSVGDRPVDPDWNLPGLTQLPDGLEPRQFDSLLRTWLPREGVSPRRVAAAVAAGLQRRCSYSLREPEGRFDHALLNFLHGNREGYCMHFASAMAIMLRWVEVPCRIGVGLYGGEADPANPGARLYGSQHAHAWVEVPIRGLGWVVFDPTPPASRATGSLVPGRREDAVESADSGNSTEGSAAADDLVGGIVSSLSQLWVWAALAVVWFLLAWRPTSRAAKGKATVTHEMMPARRRLGKILRTLAKAGFPRMRGETLELYLQGLHERAVVDARALANAFVAYQEVRFGDRPFDSERERRLTQGLDAATKARPQTREDARDR